MTDTGAPRTGPFAHLSNLQKLAVAVVAGLAVGAGQAPFDLVPLAFVGLAAGYMLLSAANSGRRAFGTGWIFGTGYFALTLHWIVEPFFVDAARHGWMAPFALVMMAGGMALFWALAFRLARMLGGSGWGLVLAWPAAMTLAEWLRGWVFTGFPWATLGHIGVNPALKWTGAIGVTLALTLAAALAAHLAFRRTGFRRAWGMVPIAVYAAVGFVAMPPPEEPANGPVVRLIQPNAPQHQKWDPEHILTFYQRQIGFTAAEGQPDLIVWPETAIPWSLSNADQALLQITEAARGTPVVLGLQRRTGRDVFNSLVVLEEGGVLTALYDKHHLVPFGEYVPFRKAAEAMGIRGLAADSLAGFSPGPGPELIETGALGTALPLICYELVFPRNVRAAPERPDYLLQITNDAWFGQTAGPQQHLAQARVRAIEFGLPVVRVANTGISAVIDVQGRVLGDVPLNSAGFADVAMPLARADATVYATLGHIPTLAFAGVLLVLSVFRPLRQAD
ncbi:MAG: apolipoprotein N-acyltransferase [Pseudomonadota bacterium]